MPDDAALRVGHTAEVCVERQLVAAAHELFKIERFGAAVLVLRVIETEEARTKDIEDMQEYMQSDEYAEKIAKEKIGLVKDNEIIFKENK